VTVIQQPEAARSRAAAALARNQAYEWRAVREQWLDTYRSVIERHGRTARAA
jgi:hypothetical protein